MAKCKKQVMAGEMHFSSKDKIIASPYILNDEEIRRDWDYIHEKAGKESNLDIFVKYAKPAATFNDNIIYRMNLSSNTVEYIVFDNPISTKATRYLFYLKFIKSKSRNGLFKSSSNGWYPSRAWRSKDSKSLGHRFVLSMLEFAFDDLDADFFVSDFMQTSVFTERFKEFLLLRLSQDRVYVGLSFNKNYPICIPIADEHELITANSLISRGGANREYAYKSIFVLKSKYALEKVLSKKAQIVAFDAAIDQQLFIRSKLDNDLKKALDRGELLD